MAWILVALIMAGVIFFVAWQRHGWEVATGAAGGVFAAIYAAGETVVGFIRGLIGG